MNPDVNFAESIEEIKENVNDVDQKKPTPKMIQQVTERVYQMLLQDLMIERERHRLTNPTGRFHV